MSTSPSVSRIPRPTSLDDVWKALTMLAETVARLDGRVTIVANGQNETSQHIGELLGEIAGMKRAWQIAGAPTPYRSPDASWHDYDAQLAEFRSIIDKQIKDPSRPDRNSEWAKKLIKEGIKQAHVDDKARVYDNVIKASWKVAIAIVTLALTALLAHYGWKP